MDKYEALREFIIQLWYDNLPRSDEYTTEEWQLWINDDDIPEYPRKREFLVLDKLVVKIGELDETA